MAKPGRSRGRAGVKFLLRNSTSSDPHEALEVRFHGQDVEVSRELRYLVADEAAAQTLGRRPHGRIVPFEDDWMQALGLALDLFDSVDQGVEAYRWLVTPNPEAGNRSPIRLLQEDKPDELVSLTLRHLELEAEVAETRRAV